MKFIERNEKGFAYFELVAGSHDHIRTRVWVNNALVKKSAPEDGELEFVEFPVREAKVSRTDKGSLVLRPCEGWTVYCIEMSSGYRGSCSIEVTGGEVMASGSKYHSPQGNLGETAWALVNAQGPIHVAGRRTGRRVDKEEVEYTIYPDGRVDQAEEEGLEAELA
jgi:hypothetical protein